MGQIYVEMLGFTAVFIEAIQVRLRPIICPLGIKPLRKTRLSNCARALKDRSVSTQGCAAVGSKSPETINGRHVSDHGRDVFVGRYVQDRLLLHSKRSATVRTLRMPPDMR